MHTTIAKSTIIHLRIVRIHIAFAKSIADVEAAHEHTIRLGDANRVLGARPHIRWLSSKRYMFRDTNECFLGSPHLTDPKSQLIVLILTPGNQNSLHRIKRAAIRAFTT